jgi:two-component system, OmpR family, KDP operon response regulator KdpE
MPTPQHLSYGFLPPRNREVLKATPLCAAPTYKGRHPQTAMRPRVLVCDGESQSLRALKIVLRNAGFEVDATSTSAEALNHAALRAPNAAIVELALPDGDGVELCRTLREWSTMPLILLSAINEEAHTVRALQAGADDYMTKPFGPQELVARLHAILRRADPIADEPIVELDEIEINLASGVVKRRGEELHLTSTEVKLLRALVHHRGRLLTHSALLLEVWGAAYERDRQTLRTHIANLRRKLGSAEGLPLIDTHHGVGYRFAGSHAANAPQMGQIASEKLSPARVNRTYPYAA